MARFDKLPLKSGAQDWSAAKSGLAKSHKMITHQALAESKTLKKGKKEEKERLFFGKMGNKNEKNGAGGGWRLRRTM